MATLPGSFPARASHRVAEARRVELLRGWLPKRFSRPLPSPTVGWNLPEAVRVHAPPLRLSTAAPAIRAASTFRAARVQPRRSPPSRSGRDLNPRWTGSLPTLAFEASAIALTLPPLHISGAGAPSLGHYSESQVPLSQEGVRPRFYEVMSLASSGSDHHPSYRHRDLNPNTLAGTTTSTSRVYHSAMSV